MSCHKECSTNRNEYRWRSYKWTYWKIYDDNLLICGDAAGQVNPIEGGGIIEGMLGGMAAGDVAAKAIKEENYSKERLHEYYENTVNFHLI